MELKIAVCDDEAVVRSALINALETLDIVFKAKEYSSGSELVMSDEEYDLIFLDIEMDGINGMETAEQLRKKGCKSNIVFLTSHTEFMQAAFRVRAFRFLEKPVDRKMLEEAVMETCAELMQDKKIVVKSGGEVVTLNCEDIISLEAFGDGTYIYTKEDVICAQAQLNRHAPGKRALSRTGHPGPLPGAGRRDHHHGQRRPCPRGRGSAHPGGGGAAADPGISILYGICEKTAGFLAAVTDKGEKTCLLSRRITAVSPSSRS